MKELELANLMLKYVNSRGDHIACFNGVDVLKVVAVNVVTLEIFDGIQRFPQCQHGKSFLCAHRDLDTGDLSKLKLKRMSLHVAKIII